MYLINILYGQKPFRRKITIYRTNLYEPINIKHHMRARARTHTLLKLLNEFASCLLISKNELITYCSYYHQIFITIKRYACESMTWHRMTFHFVFLYVSSCFFSSPWFFSSQFWIVKKVSLALRQLWALSRRCSVSEQKFETILNNLPKKNCGEMVENLKIEDSFCASCNR